MYHALYRKYRPKDFDSVVGQDAIIKTLKNSIIHHNFSHAYMFFGPRGTGKTTVSKIFARNINCTSPNEGNACGKCDACSVSFSHDCVDIIEIDAASNNGVDEIRELKSNITLVPSQLIYKVYIIDEVHILSSGAFNALLKTLEEPPEHAIFILATTDPQKVPETIISRCQCFSFKRIPDAIIKDRLKFVCKNEKIDIEDKVLDKISVLSDGGMRDALGSLDKLLSYTDKKITLEDFNEVNGVISDEDIELFINNLTCGKVRETLSDINRFNNSGKNLIQIMSQIIDFTRNEIVNYYLYNNECKYSIELLELFLNLLNEKIFDMKKSGNTKVYIEMFLLKFMNDHVLESNNNVVDKNISIPDNSKNSNDESTQNNNKSSFDSLNLNNNDFFDKKNSSLDIDDEEFSLDNYLTSDSSKHFDITSTIIPKILNMDDVMKVRINNTMATADKALLKKESDLFELLKDYSFDQEIGYLVNSLLDSKIRAVGSNNLIISYDSDAIVEQNLVNIIALEDVYHKITKSNKNIAIVSDSEWESIKIEYISKLKNKDSYVLVDDIDFVLEEIHNDDIISSSAISLFGDDIVEVE